MQVPRLVSRMASILRLATTASEKLAMPKTVESRSRITSIGDSEVSASIMRPDRRSSFPQGTPLSAWVMLVIRVPFKFAPIFAFEANFVIVYEDEAVVGGHEMGQELRDKSRWRITRVMSSVRRALPIKDLTLATRSAIRSVGV